MKFNKRIDKIKKDIDKKIYELDDPNAIDALKKVKEVILLCAIIGEDNVDILTKIEQIEDYLY